MKKFILILFFFAAIKISSAQLSLTFCEDVSNDGQASMASNSFMISKNGSALKVLLKSDSRLAMQDLTFKIFYINEFGKEEEITDLPQQVNPDWNYVWKEVVFFDPGNYRVKVYNSKGDYLTSANLNVKQQ
ncbi:MAG TPA: hypothetical protein VG603_02905 [Chitinophagales bacterium]|nr:hypothetical protein [Chitinophagales bacterium]